MNSTAPTQVIGNLCAGLATMVLLLPLQRLLSEYARKHLNDDSWVPSALFVLVPSWLLLLVALLCAAASGGFDWTRLGRTALYAFTASAPLALAVVSFVLVAMYIRPGFTPRFLYVPGIYLIPLSTALVVVLSLNPKLASGLPIHWLRWPWTVFAALSLAVCAVFFGQRLARVGIGGVMEIAQRIGNLGPASGENLAKISTLDPERDLESLLWKADRHASRETREAATARMRSHPHFLELLSAELENGHVEPAVSFLCGATLSPEEQSRLARPARIAMERWVNRIPAPNYTTRDHLKKLRRWGTESFRILTEKFAGTGVDFKPVIDDFKDKVEPSN